MAPWTPRPEDGWHPLRYFIARAVRKYEDQHGHLLSDLAVVGWFRGLFSSPVWEFCGKPGTLDADYKLIDWSRQERANVDLNDAWSGIHHPSGAAFHDVHVRARPREDRQANPPPAEPSVYRTGAPGQPTSKHLIQVEWERRAAARKAVGEGDPSGAEEARALLDWLTDKHPQAPKPTIKTIRNWLPQFEREHDAQKPAQN